MVILELSTVNCQLFTVNCLLSTVYCQFSIVNCQLISRVAKPHSMISCLAGIENHWDECRASVPMESQFPNFAM